MNKFPHGIMFHHFYNEKYAKGQGAISENDLVNIINYIGRKNILSAKEWIEKAEKNILKKSDVCFTFDDSLLSQYEIALPVLDKFKIKAFWFIYSKILTGEIEMLEVFRKFRTVIFKDIDEFYDYFFRFLRKSKFSKLCLKALKNFDPDKYLTEFSFYTNNDKKYRYLRDIILGKENYNFVMFQIMNKFRIDLKSFSADLWMKPRHLISLTKKEHIIGMHSHSHPMVMSSLSKEKQKEEYEMNSYILSRIIGEKPKSVSHPCNSYNKTTLSILNNIGVKIGFRANMVKQGASLLEMPREDHIYIIKSIKKR